MKKTGRINDKWNCLVKESIIVVLLCNLALNNLSCSKMSFRALLIIKAEIMKLTRLYGPRCKKTCLQWGGGGGGCEQYKRRPACASAFVIPF